MRALSKGGEARADPPSGTRKTKQQGGAYDTKNHRVTTLGWKFKA